MDTNWKLIMMQFHLKGAKVILKGDPSLEDSHITSKVMMKTIQKIGGALFDGVDWGRRYSSLT